MEARRQSEQTDAGQRGSLTRGWYLGGDDFKRKVLARMEGLGEHHSGGLKRETAERIIAEELARLGWTPADLEQRRKGDTGKMALADRLRKETILPMTWISDRLKLGTAKSARSRLRTWQRDRGKAHPIAPNVAIL